MSNEKITIKLFKSLDRALQLSSKTLDNVKTIDLISMLSDPLVDFEVRKEVSNYLIESLRDDDFRDSDNDIISIITYKSLNRALQLSTETLDNVKTIDLISILSDPSVDFEVRREIGCYLIDSLSDDDFHNSAKDDDLISINTYKSLKESEQLSKSVISSLDTKDLIRLAIDSDISKKTSEAIFEELKYSLSEKEDSFEKKDLKRELFRSGIIITVCLIIIIIIMIYSCQYDTKETEQKLIVESESIYIDTDNANTGSDNITSFTKSDELAHIIVGKTYTINSGSYFGSKQLGYFHELVNNAVRGDKRSFDTLLNTGLVTGECIYFNAGEKVILKEMNFDKTEVMVSRSGEKKTFWTVVEAIE